MSLVHGHEVKVSQDHPGLEVKGLHDGAVALQLGAKNEHCPLGECGEHDKEHDEEGAKVGSGSGHP